MDGIHSLLLTLFLQHVADYRLHQKNGKITI